MLGRRLGRGFLGGVSLAWRVDGADRWGSFTQKAGHVETRFHLHPADAIGQDGFRVRVHDAVDGGVSFEYFAVDAPLFVSLRYALLDGRGIFDVVFYDVGRGGDEGWGDGVGEEEGVRVVGVAEGDVAIGVYDAVVVEDVVGGYEIFEGGWVFGGHEA